MEASKVEMKINKGKTNSLIINREKSNYAEIERNGEHGKNVKNYKNIGVVVRNMSRVKEVNKEVINNKHMLDRTANRHIGHWNNY